MKVVIKTGESSGKQVLSREIDYGHFDVVRCGEANYSVVVHDSAGFLMGGFADLTMYQMLELGAVIHDTLGDKVREFAGKVIAGDSPDLSMAGVKELLRHAAENRILTDGEVK